MASCTPSELAPTIVNTSFSCHSDPLDLLTPTHRPSSYADSLLGSPRLSSIDGDVGSSPCGVVGKLHLPHVPESYTTEGSSLDRLSLSGGEDAEEPKDPNWWKAPFEQYRGAAHPHYLQMRLVAAHGKPSLPGTAEEDDRDDDSDVPTVFNDWQPLTFHKKATTTQFESQVEMWRIGVERASGVS